MTSFDGLDRRLTARLDEHAAPHAPDGLNESITESIAETAQRPAWATLERWIPMETRAQLGAVPRAVIVFALIALLTLVMATAIAIGASNPPKLPPPFGPAANGLIAFARDGDIYVVRPDGSDLRQISSGPELEWGSRWSRDGTRLAYWSGSEDGPGTLYVTDAEGADPVAIAVTQGPEYGFPEWNTDGTEIMYYDMVPELGADPCPSDGLCGSRLFVAATDGSGTKQVGDPDLDAQSPALSPDGSTVAFGGGLAGSEALYLMDWDGTDVRPIDTGIFGRGFAFGHQSWSPGGDSLVTHDGSPSQSIWRVELDAGELAGTDRVGSGFWSDYAPDGSGIQHLVSFCTAAIHDTSDASTSTVVGPCTIRWSPDSSHLVGIKDGTLVVFDRTGEEMRELGPADEDWPSWQRVAE